MQSHQLYARLLDVLEAPRLARALGIRRVDSVYRLARHPADIEDPDGTGARNDFDRIEAVIEAAVLRPGGRALVRQIQIWFEALFRRVLDGWQPEPLTDCRLMQKTATAVSEFGDFLGTCTPGEIDPERISKEGAEAIEAIERLVLAAQVKAR